MVLTALALALLAGCGSYECDDNGLIIVDKVKGDQAEAAIRNVELLSRRSKVDSGEVDIRWVDRKKLEKAEGCP